MSWRPDRGCRAVAARPGLASAPATASQARGDPGRVQVNVYDVAGRKVGRGVCFVRSSVQKGAGRVVVLRD